MIELPNVVRSPRSIFIEKSNDFFTHILTKHYSPGNDDLRKTLLKIRQNVHYSFHLALSPRYTHHSLQSKSSATHLKPMFPVELSAVLEVLAATR